LRQWDNARVGFHGEHWLACGLGLFLVTRRPRHPLARVVSVLAGTALLARALSGRNGPIAGLLGSNDPQSSPGTDALEDALEDFTTFSFTHLDCERTVYRKGTGPAVLLMHEVPGITVEVAHFARRVVDAGFTVFMPHLFGPVGVKTSPFNRFPELVKLCINREFHVLAENRSSPVADWLRGLGRHIHEEMGGRGIGVVGMCVTGNFALTLTLDPWVLAPVLGHPSLPLPITPAKAAAVHVTPETFANARRRSAEDGLKVLGVRFHGDTLFCRAPRFETLRRELGDAFEGIELPALSAKRQPEPPHSVLTIGLVDRAGEPTHEAVERILAFLSERLR